MDYPELNKEFPSFELKDQDDSAIKLSDLKGKNVVLYFYPKDNTPGCTNEACDFRDRIDFFNNLNTVVIGISPDSLKSHQKFSSKYELNFSILTDEEHFLSESLNVWQLKKNYGKEYYGIVRTTFIIDGNGILRKIYKRVRVKEHVEKVLEYIKTEIIQ
jgi:peroxiredoxin Q/BCP